ncbi:MAG: hypothetical protein QGH58_05205 [Arenicellales bacterium]|nr:hypothetical protein [Arenicellales bacterium]
MLCSSLVIGPPQNTKRYQSDQALTSERINKPNNTSKYVYWQERYRSRAVAKQDLQDNA